jgi:uncharacterized protein (TIGR00369 family)
MKEKLKGLFEDVLQNSNEEDLIVLEQMLSGLKKKQEGINGTYIGAIFHMDRKQNEHTYEVTIPLTPLTDNSIKIAHGGVTMTVLDSTMGTLAAKQAGSDYAVVTSEMHIHFLAKGSGRELKCVAKMIHKGKKIIVVEGQAFREDGTLIAHATGSFYKIPRKTL